MITSGIVFDCMVFLLSRQHLHRKIFQLRMIASRGGGRYLVYLSDGDVPFFRVSFSPIFSRTGYQKKANFLEQVVKTCQKRKFRYNGLLFSQSFCVFEYTFHRFFLEQGVI